MKKIFFSTIFCLFLGAQAYGQTLVNGIWYKFSGTEAEVTSGSSEYTGDIVIPSTVFNANDGKTYSVTSIENSAFNFSNKCKNLTSITLPVSITNIEGNYPFGSCNNLTAINVESGNANYSSDNGVLYNKDKTLLIFCPMGKTGSYIIPNSVIEVRSDAFFRSSLTSVTIPISVTSIGYASFEGSNIVSFVFLNPIPVGSMYFSGGCTIYVPTGSKEAYQEAFGGENWEWYLNRYNISIIELPQISENDINFTSLENSAQVEWQSVENAEGYRLIIFRDETHTDTVCVLEFDATGTLIPRAKSQSTNISHTINDLSSGTYYYTFEILGVGNAVLTGLSSTFEVKETTGIVETQCIASLPVGYYNLLGAKLPQEPTSGIYIIKYDNGKTEKVVR